MFTPCLYEGAFVDSAIWPWITSILAVVSIGLATLLLIEREKKRSSDQKSEALLSPKMAGMPFIARRTVSPDLYKEAQERLRVLDLEREILSYAIRRLYEAHAEGRITEEERDKLAEKYRVELARIKEEIARGESIVALSELERMQEEFIKIFSERFDELSRRIEQLRIISGLPPAEEELEKGEVEEEKPPEEQPAKKTVEAAKPKKRKVQAKPSPKPEKSNAERRVEQIVAEVEKVLKKLGRMEVEE